MKIQIVQFSPVWENSVESKRKIDNLLEENKDHSDLIIFPEMTLTGFSMKSNSVCVNEGHDDYQFFVDLAIRLKSNIMFGIVLKEGSKIFNNLVHLGTDGKTIAIYKKIHPFTPSGEGENYSSGNNPVETIINGTKVGLTVCYDLRFPELFRQYGKLRSKFIVNIANWPNKRIHHWKQLLIARAIENQCYIIGVNRIGNDPYHTYNGQSMVVDPTGEIILNLEDKETTKSIELNLDFVDTIRKKLPFLDDIKMM